MQNVTSKIKYIWRQLADKGYRDAFVSAHVDNTLAAQVFALRESRGWTQAELAQKADMSQARISVLEDSCAGVTIKTLKRLASAFDVGLTVRFDGFERLVRDSSSENVAPLVPVQFRASSCPTAPHGFNFVMSSQPRQHISILTSQPGENVSADVSQSTEFTYAN